RQRHQLRRAQSGDRRCDRGRARPYDRSGGVHDQTEKAGADRLASFPPKRGVRGGIAWLRCPLTFEQRQTSWGRLPHTSCMLVLTPDAVRAVVDFVVRQDAGPTAGLRISGGPHSAVDRTWAYAVEHAPFEGDLVIEDGPARVFVDPDAAKELEHAVLDAKVDEQTADVRFVIRT